MIRPKLEERESMIRIHSFGCHETIDDDDDGGDDDDYQSQARRKRKHDMNFGPGHKNK